MRYLIENRTVARRLPAAPSVAAVVLIGAFFWAASSARADIIVLKRGGQPIEGQIVKEDETMIVVQTSTSKFTLSKSLIEKITPSGGSSEEKTGDQMISLGRLEEGLSHYRKAAESAPDDERLQKKIKQAESLVAQSQQAQHSQEKDEAIRLAKSGQHKQAAALLQKLMGELVESPFRKEVARALAEVHYDASEAMRNAVRAEDAKEELRQAIKADPSFQKPYLELAQILFDEGSLDEADADYAKGLAVKDSQPLSEADEIKHRFNWAETQYRRKEYPKAIKNYELVIRSQKYGKKYPLALDHLVDSYILYRKENPKANTDETIAALTQAIQGQGAMFQAREFLAQLYSEKKQYKEAIEAYRAVLAIEKKRANAHYSIAKYMKAMGDKAGYRQELEAELTVNPRNYEANCDLGLLLLEGSNYDEALSHFDAAAGINSAAEDAYLGRADALRLSGKLAEAKAQCEELLGSEEEKPNPKVLISLGQVLFDQGAYDEASTRFSEAVTALTTIPNLPSIDGETAADEEPKQKPMEDLTPAEKKLLAKLRQEIGRISLQTKEYNKGEENLRKALDLDPDLLSAYRYQGDAYKALQRPYDAADSYMTAIEKDPSAPDPYQSMAVIYHQVLKKPAEALPFYHAYLEHGGLDRLKVEVNIRECGGSPDVKVPLNLAAARAKLRQDKLVSTLAISSNGETAGSAPASKPAASEPTSAPATQSALPRP